MNRIERFVVSRIPRQSDYRNVRSREDFPFPLRCFNQQSIPLHSRTKYYMVQSLQDKRASIKISYRNSITRIFYQGRKRIVVTNHEEVTKSRRYQTDDYISQFQHVRCSKTISNYPRSPGDREQLDRPRPRFP